MATSCTWMGIGLPSGSKVKEFEAKNAVDLCKRNDAIRHRVPSSKDKTALIRTSVIYINKQKILSNHFNNSPIFSTRLSKHTLNASGVILIPSPLNLR